MPDVTLHGLDGSNPLGFLAALGVLQAMSEREPGAKLRWTHAGGWRPVLSSAAPDVASLARVLDADRATCATDPALALEYEGTRDLKPPPGVYRRYLESLAAGASPAGRRSVDWAAAFASDVAVDNNGNTKPTALHFTAGQQQFLLMVRDLSEKVTADDFQEALEGPWLYRRPLPVMGWDSTSTRDYALRASNPSTDKKLGTPGADWLAVRGLACLPSFPVGTRILTTGVSGSWKTGHFQWPLWTVPIAVSVVRSLLLSSCEPMSGAERRARGIGVVFRAAIRRSDQGGYGSVGPAAVI